MKKLKLLFSFLTMAACGLAAHAQEAHNRDIQGAFSDQKGQAALTLDYNDTAKIWNLADGKLLATVSAKSTEWGTKLLRYKINHADYTKSGQTWEWPRENGKKTTLLKINGAVAAKLIVAPEYYDYNRASGTLVSYEMDNDKTSIYRHTIPAAGVSDKTTTAKPLVTVPGYQSPVISPKGGWLYLPKSFQIIHPETGAVSTVGGLKLRELQSAHYAFSPDETQLSVATEEGIAVIDIGTAKVLKRIRVPKKIRDNKAYVIYPQSDMQSFLYTGGLFTNTRNAFLVKDDQVIQLHD